MENMGRRKEDGAPGRWGKCMGLGYGKPLGRRGTC